MSDKKFDPQDMPILDIPGYNCKLREYLNSLPPEKRNDPVSFSCNCKRCLPQM